jgi:FKBP-type peptidyl-prolyl cis-trans isomerase
MKAAAALLVLSLAAVSPALAAPAKSKATAKITDPSPPTKVAEASVPDPKAFLAANAKQPGVITLPDGLQYKVTTAGDPRGPSPKPGDAIKVHYEGKLLDGTVFDSSFARGRPMLAPLGGLVPAWMEALPMMHVGDEWTLFVPPELGYGVEGQPPVIPPNSVMVFRIKLLGMLSAD